MTGCTPGGLYREAAFRYLLDSESHRSQRTGFSHYLLLLYQDAPEGGMTPMNAQMTGSVVRVLSRCLRETDYIGWYREGRVVGGVLTAMGKESGPDQIESLRSRIVDTLRAELGDKEGGSFRVRICSCDQCVDGTGETEPDCIAHYQDA